MALPASIGTLKLILPEAVHSNLAIIATCLGVPAASYLRQGLAYLRTTKSIAWRSGMLLFGLMFFYIFTLSVSARAGISLAGTSGLINIPTAEVISDQQVTIGIGYVNRYAAYLERGRCDNFPFYIVLGYLPRLEFSAGVNFVPGEKSYDGTNTYKDGVVSLQFLLFKERKFLPALALGARDIYSFILLNTSFVVASKTIIAKPTINWRLHVGYGSDIIDQHLGVPKKDRHFPVGHTIVGPFGGLEIDWKRTVTYLLEYDTRMINTGIRFRWLRYWQLDILLLNMEYWSGNLSWSFEL
ncbi:MAG: YjbH domain-containing protein [candidate division KSB1 bacterium]|nr:YjbH domain-containing protein [candidate division KSB1 bacterium]MDZ7317953.1 YjbH domain-containing protein [candidate division KSB1 bacterium]MDZ7342153.1 YjbH domain-containing protein [candidate division KSB1 bacterium]